MSYHFLKIDKKNGHIAIIKLNRPEKLNTLNSTLMNEIERLTEDLHNDIETRVVIFTGEGKHFCGGADLSEKRNDKSMLHTIRLLKRGPRLIRKIYEIEQITIAAINGGAFGGGACIATACDFRIGSEDCMAGFPESKLGMNLSWVTLPLITHLIGPTYSKEMVILGKNNDAQTLLKWGFISEIVPKEKLLDRAVDIAREYAEMPPITAQMIKRSINSIVSALDESIMHMDREQWLLTSKTDDFKEGINAFFEKRKGDYKGN